MALRSSRRGPPLGISAVEPIQEREGAKVLVKLEVVEVVVLAGLEEGQVVPGVLNQGVDHHVGVPGNLNNYGGGRSSGQESTEHKWYCWIIWKIRSSNELQEGSLNDDMTLEEHRRNSNGS